MRFFTKDFWDLVLVKMVELMVSVKIWVLFWVSFLVYKIHGVGNDINDFILVNIHSLDANKITILAGLEKNIYDISTAMLTGVIVVIVLSRQVFKHKKLDNNGSSEKDDME